MPFQLILKNKMHFYKKGIPDNVINNWKYWEFEEYIKMHNEESEDGKMTNLIDLKKGN